MIDKRITELFGKHHLMTIATTNNGLPYCANAFYAYMEDSDLFVVTSSTETKHAQDWMKNPKIAGTIALETKTIGKIRGAQFCGTIRKPTKEESKETKNAYLKRFPYAVIMDIELWVIEPEFVKMTDNKLGFGKKLIWEKEKK